MTKREALKMFGSYYRIAQVLGIHRSNIGRWKRGVPRKRAEQLQKMHDGLNRFGKDKATMKFSQSRTCIRCEKAGAFDLSWGSYCEPCGLFMNPVQLGRPTKKAMAEIANELAANWLIEEFNKPLSESQIAANRTRGSCLK